MARKRKTDPWRKFSEKIDISEASPVIKKLTGELAKRVVGQDKAIQQIGRHLEDYYADLKETNQPIAGLLFAGPSGVGKTYMAEEFARVWIDHLATRAPLTRIQCSAYSHSHEVAKLIGAPPGYLGHVDEGYGGTPPLLSQKMIDKFDFLAKARLFQSQYEEKLKILDGLDISDPETKEQKKQIIINELSKKIPRPLRSVILFDEVEKANPTLWQLLLHILGEGELALGDNTITYFNNSVVILTTNIGAKEIKKLTVGGIGFKPPSEMNIMPENKKEVYIQQIYEVAKREVEKIFPPELVGRFRNEIIAFRWLNKNDYQKILELHLDELKNFFSEQNARRIPLLLNFTDELKNFLINEGIDQTYGARVLNKVIKKCIKNPLARAINRGSIRAGDEVLFKLERGKTTICVKPRSNTLSNDLRLAPWKPSASSI